MSKIRLLEVISGFGLGGAEIAFANRMKYMPDIFIQTVLNLRPQIDAFQPKTSFTQFQLYRNGFLGLFEIRDFLISGQFEVVVVRTPLDAIRFGLVKKFSKSLKFKLIFEAHSNFLTKKTGFGFILKFLLRIVSSNIDLVISVSDNVSKGPLCSGHKNVVLIYLGSYLNQTEKPEISHKSNHLIFVGRLVELKRPLWLLERIEKVSRLVDLPKPALTMVGSGPLESSVKEFINTKNLSGLVNFVGSQMDVAPFYASATHLVSCSTNEGLPLTFFEAKLAGLSIVATPSGGGSEIFKEEDLELNSFDEHEFEEALIQIFESPPLDAKGRASIQEKSGWMSAEEGSKRYYSEVFRLLEE